jgi:hypothetical protein
MSKTANNQEKARIAKVKEEVSMAPSIFVCSWTESEIHRLSDLTNFWRLSGTSGL